MSAGPVDSPFDDKSGFDPMAVDQFFDAVEAGDEGRIKDILDKRLVDVNLSRRRGYAALHLAAARGDLATVKYLIQVKADPNVLDGSGATPVMWAVFRRHESVVRFLAPKTNLKIERQGGETAHALAQRLKMKPNIVRALDPEPKKNTAGKNAPRKRVPTSLPEKKKK
jgi:ankyrin repeat protein